MSERYDVAVLGGGLAGLSILYHLQVAGKLDGKRVLLVDPERKSGHDRTWSFWEAEPGPFEDIVYHRWPRVNLHNPYKHCTCDLDPYVYKLIRSTEFYARVNAVIDGIENFTHLTSTAHRETPEADGVSFTVDGEVIRATHVFSSKPHPLVHDEIADPYLDQHFRGWIIETEDDVFDPTTAELMDFRTPQHEETRFFYVLPFSPQRALIEIAIFSNDHLTTEAYDAIIAEYIAEHWTTRSYQVVHTEAGNIPMTSYRFPNRDGNLIYIGLGGGAARPSTGYTFYGLQRQLMRIAREFPDLQQTAPWPKRYLNYDATLLRILLENRLPGEEVFVNLFESNPPARVLAFLNGESSLLEDLRLMGTTPIATFGKAFLEEALRKPSPPAPLRRRGETLNGEG